MVRLLRSVLRWLLPRRWFWAIEAAYQRRRQVPLAQWILVHGIYLDGQNVLALPTTGAAFTEVLPVDLQVRQMVRKELMLSLENIGSKPVVFQAAVFLDDLTGHGSTVVTFGPRQVQPGEIVELAVRIMQQGWFRTLRIPSYSRQ
jgi:hypothetical protein